MTTNSYVPPVYVVPRTPLGIRHSSVGVVTRGSSFDSRQTQRIFSSPKRPNRLWSYLTSYSVDIWCYFPFSKMVRSRKLTTDLYQLTGSRMSGCMPPVFHMASWLAWGQFCFRTLNILLMPPPSTHFPAFSFKVITHAQ